MRASGADGEPSVLEQFKQICIRYFGHIFVYTALTPRRSGSATTRPGADLELYMLRPTNSDNRNEEYKTADGHKWTQI